MPTQLEALAHALVANGWSTESGIGRLRHDIGEAAPLHPMTLGRWLHEHRKLDQEQSTELDLLASHQAHFPEYRLLRKLGAGGMGTVYLALQLATNRTVAFKTINSRLAGEGDFVTRFHRETTSLVGIEHPNIAAVLASGECDGHCYLAMEYIQGLSLMDLLRHHRVLPEGYVLRAVAQIAEGLGHVWGKAGLIHRDIKPENILVVRDAIDGDLHAARDQAKLIDFGLVKSNREDDRLTQTGMTIGTPLYMSPEQIRGEALDGRSDIYGLGATVYHLITGETPFTGTSPGAIMSAHLTEAVPDPLRIVPGLRQITRKLVMMAMAKRAQDRFATGEAFAAACAEAIREIEGSTQHMRLLKKPLVVKSPLRRPSEKPAESQDQTTATVTDDDSAKRLERITSRILSKHRSKSEQAEATAKPVSAAIVKAISRAQPVQGQQPQSQAVAAPVQAGNVPVTDFIPHPPPVGTGSSTIRKKNSAAFADEPKRNVVGLAPWLFLILALLTVVAILVFRLA